MILLSMLMAVIFALLPTSAHAQILNETTFGAGAEVYLPIPVENAIVDGERSRIRTLEVTAQSKLETNPLVSAKLTVGANDSNGDLVFNVREAFANFQEMLPGFSVRAGKFYLPIGILNQTRRMSWAFTSAPFAIDRFLSDEGVVDTGLDFLYEIKLGTQAARPNFQVHAGVTNGYRFDSGVTNGGVKPMTPTHYIRPAITFDLGSSRLTTGLDYIMRVSDAGQTMRMSGLDLELAPAERSDFDWSAQAELYDRAVTTPALPVSEELGGYVFVEKGLGQFAAGLRGDYFQIRSLTDGSGSYRPNMTYGFAPVVSYVGWKNLRAQTQFSVSKETLSGTSGRTEQRLEFRLVGELGDLPKSRTPNRLIN